MMPQYRFFDKLMVHGDQIFSELITKFEETLNGDRNFQLQMPQEQTDFGGGLNGSTDNPTNNPETGVSAPGGQLV